MPQLSFAAFAYRRHGGVAAAVGAIFALGFAVGALLRPLSPPQSATSLDTAHAAAGDMEPPAPVTTNLRRFDVQTVYPAEVVRVIDGDTFQARRCGLVSASTPRCGCAISMLRSCAPAAPTN